ARATAPGPGLGAVPRVRRRVRRGTGHRPVPTECELDVVARRRGRHRPRLRRRSGPRPVPPERGLAGGCAPLPRGAVAACASGRAARTGAGGIRDPAGGSRGRRGQASAGGGLAPDLLGGRLCRPRRRCPGAGRRRGPVVVARRRGGSRPGGADRDLPASAPAPRRGALSGEL
ncbi:MAG: hypothetical protein AVDCRST_MAG57-1318, partial [uncultured Blastococcus sp.]